MLLICESLMLKVSSCLTSPSRNPSCNFKGGKKIKNTKNRKQHKQYYIHYFTANFLLLSGRLKVRLGFEIQG